MKMNFIIPSFLTSVLFLSACNVDPSAEAPVKKLPNIEVVELDERNENLEPEEVLVDDVPKAKPVPPPPPPMPPDPYPWPEPEPEPAPWPMPYPEPPREVEPIRVVEEIVDFPDVEPTFPGGHEAMRKFFKDNIVYPPNDRDNDTQGKVYVSFIIETDGSLTTIKVERGISETIDKEAMRVMRLSPKWSPAESGGRVVRCRWRLPIAFQLY